MQFKRYKLANHDVYYLLSETFAWVDINTTAAPLTYRYITYRGHPYRPHAKPLLQYQEVSAETDLVGITSLLLYAFKISSSLMSVLFWALLSKDTNTTLCTAQLKFLGQSQL